MILRLVGTPVMLILRLIVTPVQKTKGVWQLYAVGAVVAAMLLGFSTGLLWFLIPLLGWPTSFFASLGKLHGHVQLYGFLSLMTIGVAYWFLPRLWGLAEHVAMHLHLAWGCWIWGLVIRLTGWGFGLLPLTFLGGLLEALGGGIAALDLARVVWQKPAGGKGRDPALVSAVTLLSVSLPCGIVLDVLNLVGIVDKGSHMSIHLAFYGVLVPMALAMSGRLFPLYLRTRIPYRRALAGGILSLGCGLLIRILGLATDLALAVRTGEIILSVGMIGGIFALRLVEPREARPWSTRSLWKDPIVWAGNLAYLWLGVTAGWLIWVSSGTDSHAVMLEWHLLGTGYLFVLILAVGTHLLPGFARRQPRSLRVPWWYVVAALVIPLFRAGAEVWEGNLVYLLGALAGLLGLVTLGVFAWNTHLLALGDRRGER